MSAPIKVRPADDPTYDVDLGHGWILFAGIMLALAGVLNLIYGIGAISDATFYSRGVTYVIGSLHTWGWLFTIVGVIQVFVALLIWTGSEWGRWLGIGAAGANMVVQFFALPSQPGQSVMLFMVDVIVIWGLLNYGGSERDSLAG